MGTNSLTCMLSVQALTSFSFIDEPRCFSYTRKALCEVFGTVGSLCLP